MTDKCTVFGCCRNISRDGLRAAMDSDIAPGASGRLILYRGKLPLEIPAEAAYIEEAEVAFLYTVDSGDERARIDAYLS